MSERGHRFDYGVERLCRFASLPIPVPEHRFHPERKWRFDYAWPDLMLALEIDGGTWRAGGGAHRGTGFLRDLEKHNAAMLLGWCVLRATPKDARRGRVLGLIREAVEALAKRPPRAGGD